MRTMNATTMNHTFGLQPGSGINPLMQEPLLPRQDPATLRSFNVTQPPMGVAE